VWCQAGGQQCPPKGRGRKEGRLTRRKDRRNEGVEGRNSERRGGEKSGWKEEKQSEQKKERRGKEGRKIGRREA
jgi:hypothetical protein